MLARYGLDKVALTLPGGMLGSAVKGVGKTFGAIGGAARAAPGVLRGGAKAVGTAGLVGAGGLAATSAMAQQSRGF